MTQNFKKICAFNLNGRIEIPLSRIDMCSVRITNANKIHKQKKVYYLQTCCQRWECAMKNGRSFSISYIHMRGPIYAGCSCHVVSAMRWSREHIYIIYTAWLNVSHIAFRDCTLLANLWQRNLCACECVCMCIWFANHLMWVKFYFPPFSIYSLETIVYTANIICIWACLWSTISTIQTHTLPKLIYVIGRGRITWTKRKAVKVKTEQKINNEAQHISRMFCFKVLTPKRRAF